MDIKALDDFWTQHGWFMALSPGTPEQKEWCREQFGSFYQSNKGDHSVMLFREEEHRTRYVLVWGTGEDNTTFWHPV
jgi:hypothetical protein